jgi:hypothetical protein
LQISFIFPFSQTRGVKYSSNFNLKKIQKD